MASDMPQQFGLYEYKGTGQYVPVATDQRRGRQCDRRPVLLYVHGWKPDGYKALSPDNFLTSRAVYGEEQDVALPWIQAGYRVLCFLWVPLADEKDVASAEQKIWAGDEQGHRWRKSDGSYGRLQACSDVGSSFYDAFQRELQGASRVHLVGHSLGCQLVARLLELLAANHAAKLPERITLLDPYFTNFAKRYLAGKWTGERTREAIKLAAERGCAVELIKSSAVLSNPLSDTNDELRFFCAYFLLRPEFIKLAFGPGDVKVLQDRHSHARYAYLGSKGGDLPTAGVMGLADRSDAEVRNMMGSEVHFIQSAGCDIWDPKRLTFEKRKGSGTTVRPRRPISYA